MKKKVLIAIHSMSQGGVQHSLINFINAVNKEDFDVNVLVMRNNTEIINLIPSWVRVMDLGNSKNFYRSLWVLIPDLLSNFLKVFRCRSLSTKIHNISKKKYAAVINKYLLKKYRLDSIEYDVAIAYYYDFVADFVCNSIDAHKKVIFFHGSVDENPILHRELLPRFNVIVTGSPAMADVIVAEHPSQKSKICVLPYYIDYDITLKKSAEFKPEYDANVVNISSCGRLSEEKGYDIAATAAGIMNKAGIKFRWYHVGDGPARDSVERIVAEYGIENVFTLLGVKKNPFPYIVNSDIFVQPSRFDGNPLSVVEAKMLCVPVVSTKTLGGKFLVDSDTGLLSDIDARSLADVITEMIVNIDLRNNCKKQLRQIDYSNAYSDYSAIVKSLLN